MRVGARVCARVRCGWVGRWVHGACDVLACTRACAWGAGWVCERAWVWACRCARGCRCGCACVVFEQKLKRWSHAPRCRPTAPIDPSPPHVPRRAPRTCLVRGVIFSAMRKTPRFDLCSFILITNPFSTFTLNVVASGKNTLILSSSVPTRRPCTSMSSVDSIPAHLARSSFTVESWSHPPRT